MLVWLFYLFIHLFIFALTARISYGIHCKCSFFTLELNISRITLVLHSCNIKALKVLTLLQNYCSQPIHAVVLQPILIWCSTYTQILCEQRFISCMAFSIYKVYRVGSLHVPWENKPIMQLASHTNDFVDAKSHARENLCLQGNTQNNHFVF